MHARAVEWSMTRGARSGRVAWQFIQDLAGKLEVKVGWMTRVDASRVGPRRRLRLPELLPGGWPETTLLLLLACCISLGQGQDRNWDLLNYHLCNAFSFLRGRFARDLYPVAEQSYFNPLLDVPYYLLAVDWLPNMPRLVAFLAGLPFGLLIVVLLRIARALLPAIDAADAWLAPLATAFGMTGSATWSEIGTTYGDMPVAVVVLCGLLVLLQPLRRDPIAPGAATGRTTFLSGLLFGCAAGLKPTACIFAPGAVLALAVTAGGVRRALCGATVFCLAWAVGVALVYGWWGWLLYHRLATRSFRCSATSSLLHGFPRPPLPILDSCRATRGRPCSTHSSGCAGAPSWLPKSTSAIRASPSRTSPWPCWPPLPRAV